MLETDYEKQYKDYKAKTDAEKSACKQLDLLRECLVNFDQIKNTYWRRPCLRDWPCFFTQHRSEIDKLAETLAPMHRRLIRECEKESVVSMYRQTLGGDTSSASNSTNANINHHGDGHVIYQPNVNFPKPTV